jgi:hypothetical protein
MTYDYFIAGRWLNREAVLDLTRGLRDKGKTVYCFLEADDGTLLEYQSFDDLSLTDTRVTTAYNRDMAALKASESLIMLMPAGKSSHIEAGIAYGLGKACILIGDMGPTQGLYLIFRELYPSIDEFLQHL